MFRAIQVWKSSIKNAKIELIKYVSDAVTIFEASNYRYQIIITIQFLSFCSILCSIYNKINEVRGLDATY
jgi:hypothetical protein